MTKDLSRIGFTFILMGLGSQFVSAASASDEWKEETEKSIKRLESRLDGTRLAVKENRNRITDANDRLRINGFLTAGAAFNDGSDLVEPTILVGDDYRPSTLSKAGLQFNFRIADDWNVITQLVSKGVNDYRVEAEWAYVNWEVSDSFQVKVGRQRAPFYLLSEYLDVGYALPWTYAPVEMYNLTTSTVDGISGTFAKRAGAFNIQWMLYGGSSRGQIEDQDLSYRSNDAFGTTFTTEIDSWLFRLGYSVAKIEASPGAGGLADQFFQGISSAVDEVGPRYGLDPSIDFDLSNAVDAQYVSAGFTFDDGKVLVMGEIANLRLVDSYQPAGDSGYLMIGYRFGKWMPNITFAKWQTDSNSDSEVRALQSYLNQTANALYSSTPPGAPGLASTNASINSNLASDNGLPPSAIPSAYLIPGEACAVLSCSSNVLAGMGIRDALLEGATAYGETLYNLMEQRIQEQQSISIGVVYEVTAGIKAKLQASFYEQFGKSSFQYLDIDSATFGGSQVDVLGGFNSVDAAGIGRFISEAGSVNDHTAIYSFTVDAVF